MSLNIQNLNTLIAHLEAQPASAINMAHPKFAENACGYWGCIQAHAERIMLDPGEAVANWLGDVRQGELTMPSGWEDERGGAKRYPAYRVIATLKRLSDHYLATGEIKVDWGPEPGEAPADTRAPWSAPQAVETRPPASALPDSLTRILASQPTPDLVRGA